MSSIKSIPSEKDNNDDVEKVYVDWPEDNDSDNYRFVSSRIDNHTDEFSEVTNFNNEYDDVYVGKEESNDRYEDYGDSLNDQKNYDEKPIPPLELISQTSSVDLPGTKGIIDIDLRSSISGSSVTVDDSLIVTHLPEVGKSDLIINYTEYDSAHQNELPKNSAIEEKRSEIEIYEAAKHRMNQQSKPRKISPEINVKLDSVKQSDNNNPPDVGAFLTSKYNNTNKPTTNKPTMLVAPQRKPPLLHNIVSQTTKLTPNFVEMNKNTVFQSKNSTNESYSSKFVNRAKKDKLKAIEKENVTNVNEANIMEKVKEIRRENEQDNKPDDDYHREYDETVTRNYHDVSSLVNNEQYRSIALDRENRTVYAFGKNEEPIIINADNVVISGTVPSLPVRGYPYHSPRQQIFQQPKQLQTSLSANELHNMELYYAGYNDSHAQTSGYDPRYQKQSSDLVFQRQPTLYDINTLDKKVKKVSADITSSRFPPLNSGNTSASKSNSNNVVSSPFPDSSSYAANYRRRGSSYDKYTLRDYKNIQNIDRFGGLGPNIGSSDYIKSREKFIRQKEYAKLIEEKNKADYLQQKEKIQRMFEQDVNFPSPEQLAETEKFAKEAAETKIDAAVTDDERLKEYATEQPPPGSPVKTLYYKNQNNKRDAMLNYAKSLKERKVKKSRVKDRNSKTNSEIFEPSSAKYSQQLFDNSDLERLLMRHEEDKKLASQIRQKLGKIS